MFHIKNGEELTKFYLKSDVVLLDVVFEKFNRISIEEYPVNPLDCVSLAGYAWQCGMKYTDIKLQTRQDKDLVLTSENNIHGGIGSVMGVRCVKSVENKKILHIDANNLYGCALSENLPHDELKFDRSVKFEDILNTPDDSDIGSFNEVDLKHPDNIKSKTKTFPFATKKIFPDIFTDYLKKIIPYTYTQTRKLITDWSDKKNCLIQYRLLKFYVRLGMKVERVHNIISFKQIKLVAKF